MNKNFATRKISDDVSTLFDSPKLSGGSSTLSFVDHDVTDLIFPRLRRAAVTGVCRYNGKPHGLFSVDSDLQSVVVLPSMERQLVLNITRSAGLYGSVRVDFALRYDQVVHYLLFS